MAPREIGREEIEGGSKYSRGRRGRREMRLRGCDEDIKEGEKEKSRMSRMKQGDR